MAKNTKEKLDEPKSSLNFQNFKKGLISLGIVGLIGLLADFLGIFSFFKPDVTKIENQTNINKQDNSVNTLTYNTQITNQNNFIDRTKYNSQTINQFFPNQNNISEDKTKVIGDISKAVNYYNDNKLDLALEYMNKYQSPPKGLDPTFFYTLKANILFFRHNYDSSYYYHRLAYDIDKNSKSLELRKLKGLTIAYIHMQSCGYTLHDLKNIEVKPHVTVYDLGFKEIEMPTDGWIYEKGI